MNQHQEILLPIALLPFAAGKMIFFLVTPSDHLIEEEYEKSVLIQAAELAKENYIVTFGLKIHGLKQGLVTSKLKTEKFKF